MNREQWLTEATRQASYLVSGWIGEPVPEVQVSVGWPSRRIDNVLGQCWQPKWSLDGSTQIFISPLLSDSIQVLATIVHELCHAVCYADPEREDAKHSKPFEKLARLCKLEGKPSATTASEELAQHLLVISESIGAYPHAGMNLDAVETSTPKKSTTRMIKVYCANDECSTTEEFGDPYMLRMTKKWIEGVGAPDCPTCNTTMLAQLD